MHTLIKYLRPKAGAMSLQLSIKLLATIVELMLPSLLKHMIDEIAPLKQEGPMILWGGLMVLCAGGALVGNVVANRMATRISRGVTETLRHDLFARIETLSCRQTDAFTIPTLISRLSSDTYNVHQMIDRMQRLGVRAPIMLIGGVILTLFIDPVLTLVLVAVLPLLAFVVVKVTRTGVPLYTLVQQAVDGLVRKVQEFMTGIRVVKALSKTEYEKEHFDAISREVVKRDQRAGTVMAVTNPVMNLLLNIGLTAVIVVGAYRVNGGMMKPGTIVAFLNYFTIILTALMMVTRMFVMYSKGSASARRIEEVLLAPEDMGVNPETPLKDEQYHIQFDDVCFSYNKKRDNLSHVSFALKRGETLGVIGATGSGKSTLIALLMRFYDADSGEIRIGGRRIDEIPAERLHTMFGAAFQNDFLMADTIRANIDFERGLSDEDIERAVRDAQADFIHTDKEGLLDDLTVKGANLSGGQKQRLLIARALAGNAEILVLDDASSALDYKTDALLRRALSSYEDMTKVIIAQRVSSVQGADHILVLDDGRVLGSGTHEQLLAQCASYREIYDAQMGEDR